LGNDIAMGSFTINWLQKWTDQIVKFWTNLSLRYNLKRKKKW